MKMNDKLALTLVTGAAAALFLGLYAGSLIPVEEPGYAEENSLEDWDITVSDANKKGLHEDKGIYEQDSNLYDVYISIFPTKNEKGEMIDFSAFSLHTALDHSYNPVLNCNVQILQEGQKPDPLTDLDAKNATIRVRGNSSRGSVYKSYKLKLEQEAGTFYGHKNLNINKHSGDVSKVSTKLQTDLLAQIDNIASYRTYFMRLWIRDAALPEEEQEFKYYGLYTETEQPNKTYLEARGLSSNATMYKASDFSFARNDALRNVDDLAYSEEEFETVLSIREGESHEKLLAMLEDVNDMTQDFEKAFHTHFDEENYLTWLAFNMLVGNGDILNHNFIIYSPQNSATWYFIPWDFDGALRFGGYAGHETPIALGGIQKLNMGILHRRYLRLDGSCEKLEAKMDELLETAITRERVTELVNSYKDVLEKTITLEPDLGLLRMRPDEMFPYLDNLYDGILSNHERFKVSIQYPAPMFVARPERLPDGSIWFSWEPAYSYQGHPITYNIRIYEDMDMERLVYEKKDIEETQWIMKERIAPGIYYLAVTATDREGHEQLSLEHLESSDVHHWYYKDGLMEFAVQ